VYTGGLAPAAVGGFACGYADADAEHPGSYPPATLVSVIVVPSVVADPSELAASLAPQLCGPDAYADTVAGEGSSCAATNTVAGWWYSLSVTNHKENVGHEQESAFKSIEADLGKALTSDKAPASVNVVHPLDCAAASIPNDPLVSSRLIGDGILGPVDPVAGDDDVDPFEPPTDEEVLAAASLLAGSTTCDTTTSYSGWTLTVFPGGASAYAQCVEGVGKLSTTTDPGVKSAFTKIEYAAGGGEVCATDGKSVVDATDVLHEDGQPWGAKILKSLGALLVPVFAATASSGVPWTASLPAVSASAVKPLLGGDCAKLLDWSAAATALGKSQIRNPTMAGAPTLATVGGLDCVFSFGRLNVSDDVTLVTANVAPSAIADPAELAASLSPPACDSGYSPTCAVTATVNGWWYSLEADLIDVSSRDVGTAFKAITANLERTLKSAAAPGRVTVAQPFDCASAVTGGTPVIRSRAMQSSPFWAGTGDADTDMSAAAFLLAGPVTCKFPSDDNVPWYLTVYPGGASAYRQCTHVEAFGPGKPISVPGIRSVTLVPSAAFGAHVCATDGTNTVLAVSYLAGHFKNADRTTLTALLVPVFAAIK
jgi:hypothetical protein